MDAETQGKIISAVHSRIPIVTPNEQRSLRVRPRPQQPKEKASPHAGAKERPQNAAPTPPRRRRVKEGTILKSTFFGALVLRMETFGMRKIRHGGD